MAFTASPEEQARMAALGPPPIKPRPQVSEIDQLNKINANLLLPADSMTGRGFIQNQYRHRTHLGGAHAEAGPRISEEAVRQVDAANPTQPNSWNGYSAREHRPGITEIFSPRGFKEGTRFFTNLIEAGADSNQLQGHDEWARRQPREVSMRGGQGGGSFAALSGGLSQRTMPGGYSSAVAEERRGPKFTTIGRSYKPRGYGGLAALAVMGNERKQEMAEREVDNRKAIADRELGLRTRVQDREDVMTPYEQMLRSAQTENYLAEADQRRRALEGDEFALQMYGRTSDRDRMAENREKAIFSLYERLAQSEAGTEERRSLEDQLNILLGGGTPGLKITPKQEAVPGSFLPQIFGGKPGVKAIEEKREWVDRRTLGQ
jgi:hypothetical protein